MNTGRLCWIVIYWLGQVNTLVTYRLYPKYLDRQAWGIVTDPNQTNWSGPEVINVFSCLTQLSMKFVLLINLRLLTIANFLLNMAEHEHFSANKYENANYFRSCITLGLDSILFATYHEVLDRPSYIQKELVFLPDYTKCIVKDLMSEYLGEAK